VYAQLCKKIAYMKNPKLELRTEIEINASTNEVWEALVNLEDYKNWNPFITKANGYVIENQVINVNPGGIKFSPTVLKVEPNKQFNWLGKLWFKGLFYGEHSFELITLENNRTLFKHSEKFKGILVPLFKKMLNVETKASFIEMNQALKKRVEVIN